MKEHRIHNYIDVHRRVNGPRLRGNSGLINTQQQVRSNQTQTGINELMTGNRKDHIWVWKHKEEEDKV